MELLEWKNAGFLSSNERTSWMLYLMMFLLYQRFTLDHTRLIQEGIDDETNSQWKKPVEDASEKAVGSNDLLSCCRQHYLWPVELDKLSVGQYVALDKAEWSNRPLIEHVENTAPIPWLLFVTWRLIQWNSAFRDWYVGSGANRRPWTEDMAKSQIVMIVVQFTNSRIILKNEIDEHMRFLIMNRRPILTTVHN